MKIDQFVSDWSKNIRAKPKSQFLRSSTRRAPTMARPGTVDYGKWDKLAADVSDDEEEEEVAQEERRQRDQLDREQRSRLLPGTFVATFAGAGLGSGDWWPLETSFVRHIGCHFARAGEEVGGWGCGGLVRRARKP